MSRGGYYNKGEGIRMALEIGAAPCGDFGSYHASPMDPRSNRAGPSIYIYPYGILVNKDGMRFTDEAPGPTDETYEAVTRTIFAQPSGIAWTILDAKLEDVPHQSVAIRTEQPAIEAATLAELAGKLGIPADMLGATVRDYNAACRPAPSTRWRSTASRPRAFTRPSRTGPGRSTRRPTRRIRSSRRSCSPSAA